MDKYKSISCDVYDRLEGLAVTRQQVCVEFRDANEETRRVTSTISDILARDGAEYIVLASGEDIRLDKIISVKNQSA